MSLLRPGPAGYPQQAPWLAQPGHRNGVAGGARGEHQVYDHKYILAEAQRKKQEVDGGLAKQLAHIDLKYQEERGNILKQAESHAQLAEKEVAAQAKERHAQLQRQEDIQAHAIGHEADAEKARLGHAAATAIAAHMEQQKARVHQEALREAEDMWRESQRALLEKAHKAKIEIELTAKRRTADIEEQVREALSRIYLSPHTSTLGHRLRCLRLRRPVKAAGRDGISQWAAFGMDHGQSSLGVPVFDYGRLQ